MKKTLVTIILAFASTLCWGQVKFADESERLVKDGYSVITANGPTIYPFMTEGGKFGFVRGKRLAIAMEAIYDDLYISDGVGMVGVKYQGKWGAVDTNLYETYITEQPIVKCEYDAVVPLDDTHVRVKKDGKEWVIDIRKLTKRKMDE